MLFLALLTISHISLAWGQSNLPPAQPGLFAVSSSIEINATISQVWEVLLDFPSYPAWNPFVRSQIVTDVLSIPTESQQPAVGLYLNIFVQIPPLPEPVNASTPPNPLHTQFSREIITTVDTTLYRVAWMQITYPQIALNATRDQALSNKPDGGVLYEAREVYGGALAAVLESLYGTGLQEAFDAQAMGLKMRSESL